MLFSILSGGNWRDIIIDILLCLPVILMALSFHEAAHAFVAFKMGDRTAYHLGRVTLNPAKHLDLWGTACMLIIGYGWAKPVPINARNFKNPKKGMALTAIAGPIANFILGVIGTLLCSVVAVVIILNMTSFMQNEFLFNVMNILFNFFFYLGIMNFILMFFNLIPVPPFDGSRFFGMFLPTKLYFDIMKYERYILLAMMLLVIVCSRVFNFSPFGWLGETLFNWIYEPVTTTLLNLFI